MIHRLKSSAIFGLALCFAAPAFAESRPGIVVGKSNFTALFDRAYSDEAYQIGDTWGKTPVDATMVRNAPAAHQRLARATAKYSSMFGGGTGFYLGKFNGQHLMGTNHHVADGVACGMANISLPFMGDKGVKLKCERVIKTWKEIDFAIVVLKVPAEAEATLEGNGIAVDFTTPITAGQKLITFGYGSHRNPGQRDMMVNQDDDCRVFSGTDDFRLLADPDTMNPADYSAWSFSNGCDISHGDSGSAFADRDSGKMIGIVWTAATPKDANVRSSAWLSKLLPTDAEVWTKLSYTVPAKKIREHLETELTKLPAADADLVKAFITQ